MKTQHSGIEIEYVEQANVWEFELRGRARKAESLAKAKEAIDKEPPEKRAQKFPRFKAYMLGYADDISVVEVTGIADGGWRNTTYFWVNKDGRRSKEHGNRLYPINAHNNAIVETIQVKWKERQAISDSLSALIGEMQEAKVPEELAA